MVVNKINSDGSVQENIAYYHIDDAVETLICYLEQFINKNYNTWSYQNSSFRNNIEKTKFGGACYFIAETNESYCVYK